MKKALTIIALFFVVTITRAQEEEVTTFHRMLIVNKENKILVVKVKNRDLWLTPGLYQNSKQTIKQGMDSIAKTYGIKVFDVELRGVYGLINRAKNYYSTRNIFLMKTDTEQCLLPENIEKVLWLNLEEVTAQVNIPHINDFIKDVYAFPNVVRLGTIERFVNKGKIASKIVEEFYSLKK